MLHDSPYEEHEDERRPCPECGGTHVEVDMQGQGQPCSLCGPPSRPDPEAQVALFRRTAAMLRDRAAMTANPKCRELYIADALYFETRVAQITGTKGVA